MSPRASSAAVTAQEYQFEHQATATDTQTPPVQNTWYTALDTSDDPELMFIAFRQTNDDLGAENVEVRAIVDGVTYTAAWAAAHDTWYYLYRHWGTDALVQGTTILNAGYTAKWNGHAAKVDHRMTAVVPLGTSITLRVVYGEKKAT